MINHIPGSNIIRYFFIFLLIYIYLLFNILLLGGGGVVFVIGRWQSRNGGLVLINDYSEVWTVNSQMCRHFLRLSVRDVSDISRVHLSIIFPGIITGNRFYFSERCVTCPKYRILLDFMVFDAYQDPYPLVLVRCHLFPRSTRLIFIILRYVHTSNTWTRLIEDSNRF